MAVIATAISLSVRIEGRPRDDSIFRIHMPDLPDDDEFDGREELPYLRERDYVRSATNVLRRAGLIIDRGFDCTITGTIPLNAGTSSSSALTVAWVAFLLASQSGDVRHSRQDIAKFAHIAEVVEFGEPGGMMDHYTSAVGGLLYIDCQKPITYEPLAAELSGFVLGDSGVSKKTKDTLRRSREAANEGFRLLAEMIPGFDIRTTPIEQIDRYLDRLPEDAARVVRAQIIDRDLCREARRLLSRPQLDSDSQARLGEMLLEHQRQLRDGVGVSHPKLDELIDAAMGVGALGGKLNGSGMGGCMFAYAPGREAEVKAALEAAGARAYIVSCTQGVRVNIERWL